MCCEQDVITRLRALGQRVTPLRVVTATVLRHAQGHIPSTTLLAQVQQTLAYNDRPDVARTLALLTHLGLVAVTEVGGGQVVYEWVEDDPPYHLVCRHCGALTHVAPEALASLAATLAVQYAFALDLRTTALPGLCTVCTALVADQPDDLLTTGDA